MWSNWNEHLHVCSHDSQGKNGGLPSLCWVQTAVLHILVSFKSEGKNVRGGLLQCPKWWGKIDKRELSLSVKLSCYLLIYVPPLTCCHELCLVSKERNHRYKWPKLASSTGVWDRLRGSDIWKGLGIEPLSGIRIRCLPDSSLPPMPGGIPGMSRWDCRADLDHITTSGLRMPQDLPKEFFHHTSSDLIRPLRGLNICHNLHLSVVSRI